ncbi:hypothetical protein [Dermatophilus congolensis]|uniref:hypothetical protein n=1 Tax=Dermatophilus congolensis TaxID=1863 RepID=UPI001AAE399D|nr:hypothetical protein [Dermatophilus congolensis]MBO3129882.1 hypothetical protein [Dermatophilus congolensis]MBO3131488.1 hypothetical protein [Dermatophilus congolensis]MBO3134356.1 hypothetical protein [Dermatophilus congolensis]MBO3136591.1 hypothetical protein [Dermatophilus congolensis]MBO3138835.1 hypothetical protein [Dermatophilus congolensis]
MRRYEIKRPLTPNVLIQSCGLALILSGCGVAQTGGPKPATVGITTVTSPIDEGKRRTQLQLLDDTGALVDSIDMNKGVSPPIATSGKTVWAASDEALFSWTKGQKKQIPYPVPSARPVGLWERRGGGGTVLLDLGAKGDLESYRHLILEIDGSGKIISQINLKAMVWAAGICSDEMVLVTSTANGNPGGIPYQITRISRVDNEAPRKTPLRLQNGVNVEPGELVCRNNRAAVAASRSEKGGKRQEQGAVIIELENVKAAYISIKDMQGNLYLGKGLGGKGAAWTTEGIIRPECDGRLGKTDPLTGKTSFSHPLIKEVNASSNITIRGRQGICC